MTELLVLFFSTILYNNVVVSSVVGAVPAASSIDESTLPKQTLAVTFMMLVSGVVSFLLNEYVLKAFGLAYLNLLVYVVVSVLVYLLTVKSVSKAVSQEDELFNLNLVLLTFILSVVFAIFTVVGSKYNLIQTICFSIAMPIGFMFITYILEAIQYRLKATDVFKPFKGYPIVLITLAIIALALSGLNGII